MTFNSEKFECLRYWPKVTKPETSYKAPDDDVIEEKESLRDLGVAMSNDLSFSLHISNIIAETNRLIGWVMRSFRSRSRLVMITVWKSLIQSKLDFNSQLWSPNDQGTINRIESVARHFTSKISGMEGKDYWERLQSLDLFSQERRRERSSIIFLWKVSIGLVKGYSVTFVTSDRRGLLITASSVDQSCTDSSCQSQRGIFASQGCQII